jgi:S1-C subfamily serine protease
VTPNRGLLALLILPGGLALASVGRLEAPARTLGVEFARGLPALPAAAPAVAPSPVMDEATPDVTFMASEGATTASTPGANGSTPKKKGNAKKAPSSSHGGPSIYVSARTILRLANARAVPRARSVAATEERPGGVQLLDVSALGVGMQDGDVITEVAGRAVRGEGDIVAMVLSARSRQAPTVSAVFYRGKVRGSLVVAMPYVNE